MKRNLYMNKILTLDEVIERLQEAKKIHGNIPITICIKDTENCIDCSQYTKEYNIKDIVADKDAVTIYNY